MASTIWRVLRWVIAVGLCVLVVLLGVPAAIDAVTSSVVIGDPDDRESGELEPIGEVPTGPVDDGRAGPDTDFNIRGGIIGQTATETLTLREDGDVVVLVFPLIDGAPECVARAELRITLLEAGETQLGAYAGSVWEDIEDGAEADDPRRDDTVHAMAYVDGSPGRLRWNLTDLYRDWASGELAPPESPFMVVLAIPDEPVDVVFASSASEDADEPVLVWEGDPDCGSEEV